MFKRFCKTTAILIATLCLTVAANAQSTQWKDFAFAFGSTPAADYSAQAGFGFEPGATLHVNPPTGSAKGDASSDKPFFFSVALPQGNYQVTVTFGDAQSPSDNTVYAELRRLMVERVTTAGGEFQSRTFIVNVRTPAIAGGGAVKITGREKTQEAWAWDDRLTLEFNGAHPAVSAITIQQANVPTLFLMGDSTVCDQPSEPFNSWGQMLTRFLKPRIAVSNQAESGESTAGGLGKGRFAKIFGDMKPGDWLIVQFGHNDMKSKAPDALESYGNNLRKVVDETRRHGGFPILCTPVSRRTFGPDGKITNSFNGYPDAVRTVAKEKNVPLIDLQNIGAAFYESMGPDVSHQAFATPQENTHHSDYGSYQIAQCVVQSIKDLKLPLADYVVDDFKPYDPSHPQAFADFKLPHNPHVTNITPLGN